MYSVQGKKVIATNELFKEEDLQKSNMASRAIVIRAITLDGRINFIGRIAGCIDGNTTT